MSDLEAQEWAAGAAMAIGPDFWAMVSVIAAKMSESLPRSQRRAMTHEQLKREFRAVALMASIEAVQVVRRNMVDG